MVKKVVVAGIAGAIVVVAVAAVLLGVFLGIPKPTNPGSDSAGSFAFPLPASGANEILVAEDRTTANPDGSPRVVARSYQSNPWETVSHNEFSPVNVTCLANGTCVLYTRGDYSVRALPVPGELLQKGNTDVNRWSRLHLQATFGADLAELQRVVSVYGANVGNWIKDQISLAPTYTRVYYRQRTNPRRLTWTPSTDVAVETQPCELNTRWQRYVFELRDRFKSVEVRNNEVSGFFTLYIDGIRRGEVSRWMNQNHPGTNLNVTFPATFRICIVNEGIDAPMTFTNGTGTACNVQTQFNPTLVLTGSHAGLEDIAAGAATFVPVVAQRSGSFVMKTRSAPCGNLTDAGGNSFLRVGGTTYRFDRRLRFISNTLQDPAPVDSDPNFQGQCPMPPRAYSNVGSCVRRTTCASPAFPEGGLACGSEGEVPNMPELGHHYYSYLWDNFTEASLVNDFPSNGNDDYSLVVNNVALKANDQLRQRVAWNLANIFTFNPTDIEADSNPEGSTSYFDIFVRHAFGTYINVMRDVSYHPMMGAYLTFNGNQAFAASGTFPDENYAREIMQLFSIGLWKLNDDGTQMKDAAGNPMATYTNDDIVDFSRVWTGFSRRTFRRNTNDARFSTGTANYIDPMFINPSWRDRLPKAKLDEGYLGDTYPLCDEQPTRMFLRQGAVYEYSGTVSFEGATLDNDVNSNRRGRLTPTSGSALYNALCSPRQDGTCQFPLRVTLTSNLACSGSQECGAVGRVRVIRIVDTPGNATRYYRYIPPPCVRMSLFSSGRVLRRATTRAQCADPSQAIGAPVCCAASNPSRAVGNFTSEVLYSLEAVPYSVAQSRCSALGWGMCTGALTASSNFQVSSGNEAWMWTNATCRPQIQIYGSGQVGVIDRLLPANVARFNVFYNNSNSVFRVRWDGDSFPTATGNQCPAGCVVQNTLDGPSCVCDYDVTDDSVFSTTADLSALAGQGAVAGVASRLFIGASNPRNYDSTYRACADAACTALTGVTVWLHESDTGSSLSQKTIFELPPFRLGGRPRFLFNRISTVVVSGAFSFRNPPRFTPLHGEVTDSGQTYHRDELWVHQAEYEVEALLEHLHEHDSTAPFVAYRFIQQMVTSNPSPRYVKEVVQAFRTGRYGTEVFSSKYGDLAATVYAVLMDREARSPLLEADSSFGMLRDPLLKVYHIMRALDYTAYAGREINMNNMINRIGVQAFKAPSVFGYYLPEFQTPGPATVKGLVAPAGQLATSPNLIGFLNGATSLVDFGLSSCQTGFGVGSGNRSCNANLGPAPNRADGELTYRPTGTTADEIVDELDLLLTTGRLNSTSRQTLIREYTSTLTRTNNTMTALRHVIKLFIASPEFNSNGVNLLSSASRTGSNEPPAQGRRPKNVIVVFLNGGADSHNMFVPHSNCPTKDLYAEYATVRQGAAINQSALLTFSTPAGTQPCDTWGFHPAMVRMRQLYNDGDAAMVANIGALVEPVTLDEYRRRVKKLPPSLFAHNVMQRSLQNMHPQLVSSNGILGRIMDTLTFDTTPAYRTAIFSLSGKAKMVQGNVPADMISPSAGVVRLRDLNALRNGIGNLTSRISESAMSETFSDAISQSISKTEYLASLLTAANLSVTFPNRGLNQQFNQVARLIKSLNAAPVAERTERLAFFTERGGWDTHATFDLFPLYDDIDSAIGRLSDELKNQGVWDDTVIISVSDFARTLTSNGAGTDHAWGGNAFVVGGKVRGGRMYGKYPTALTDDGPLSLGRGRLIPDLPFESVWQGIAEWLGISATQMPKVLPNAANFPADSIFTQSELFEP